MPLRDPDIYASPPMRGLLAEEIAALLPELRACVGAHALQISAVARDTPPLLPSLGHWTCLRIAGDRYAGDLHARVDEPLPLSKLPGM